jgi:hypothetical protein
VKSSCARAISFLAGPECRQPGKIGGIPGNHFTGIERYDSGIGFMVTFIISILFREFFPNRRGFFFKGCINFLRDCQDRQFR